MAAGTSTVPSGPNAKFDYTRFYEAELEKKHKDKSYRYFNNINRLAKEFPQAHGAKKEERVTVWCSNDYLGMGRNPQVLKQMHETLDEYGSGAGGTRNISGHNKHAIELEGTLAKLHAKEAALVFSSCYVANDATLATLGSKMPDCVILSDSLNHASMIQGIRHSGTRKIVFKHNDLEDLEAKLASLPLHVPKIIAFESVYSMCGSIGPIAEICDLAEKYGAITFWMKFMPSACTARAVLVSLSISISKPISRADLKELSWIEWISLLALLERPMAALVAISQGVPNL